VARVVSWPIMWVAMEYFRAHLPLGLTFPWNSLGQTLYRSGRLLQNADWGSFYGLSFLIVFINSAIDDVLRRRIGWKRHMGAAGLLLALYTGYGAWRYTLPAGEKPFRVGIVQGNVDLNTKWIPSNRQAILDHQIVLSESMIPQSPDVLVWSESAIPFIYRLAWQYPDSDGQPPGYRIAQFMENTRIPLVTGTLDRQEGRMYNAAVLTAPGHPDQYYYKEQLVPFGEYIPAQRVFRFVNRLVDDSIGEFGRGESDAPFVLPGGPRIAMTICYENIFPTLVRDRVRAGGEVICNITNDAWFGDTSGPFQHFSASCFRAVETRRPVVRCANSGVSGAVDALGRIVRQSSLNTTETCVVTVYPDSRSTLYLVFGDWFANGCMVLTFLLYCIFFVRHYRDGSRRKSCQKNTSAR
ncbi:apolipoprotein N-acyltransferase, partial [bacterium]|nr:apolipoprotein N-acyltransferase [candidate division CSSED10-310 bacterium]